jgi:hypothetical protein
LLFLFWGRQAVRQAFGGRQLVTCYKTWKQGNGKKRRHFLTVCGSLYMGIIYRMYTSTSACVCCLRSCIPEPLIVLGVDAPMWCNKTTSCASQSPLGASDHVSSSPDSGSLLRGHSTGCLLVRCLAIRRLRSPVELSINGGLPPRFLTRVGLNAVVVPNHLMPYLVG